mmetsp:Transcript_23396/g.59529  ORF Transcript_23396/g.59529 Transcript_23396/m.59529 type:complete len:216 (+) Transcript_23396:202-849(+)
MLSSSCGTVLSTPGVSTRPRSAFHSNRLETLSRRTSSLLSPKPAIRLFSVSPAAVMFPVAGELTTRPSLGASTSGTKSCDAEAARYGMLWKPPQHVASKDLTRHRPSEASALSRSHPVRPTPKLYTTHWRIFGSKVSQKTGSARRAGAELAILVPDEALQPFSTGVSWRRSLYRAPGTESMLRTLAGCPRRSSTSSIIARPRSTLARCTREHAAR